jgi:hypothetical protein
MLKGECLSFVLKDVAPIIIIKLSLQFPTISILNMAITQSHEYVNVENIIYE